VYTNLLEEYQYKTTIKNSRETRKHKTDTDNTDNSSSKLKQVKLFDSTKQNISQQKKFEENILHYVVGSMKPLLTVDVTVQIF